MVLTRYALGITSAPMTASTRYASLDPLQVKANIECVGCALDMNGDNQIDSVDATIIARHLAGFTGAAVTNGLTLGAGSRNTTAAVTSFLANGCAVGGAINAFVQGGNSFGAPAVLGTNDAQPLTVKSGGTDIKIVNLRGDGTRITYVTDSPNTIGGNTSNTVASGVYGATIGGGGSDTANGNHQVTGNHGTVSGGRSNKAWKSAVVAGGDGNVAGGFLSAISGRFDNEIFVAGAYSTITGGSGNRSYGLLSTILGGTGNITTADHSIAGGTGAWADKDGTFVWADGSTTSRFAVTQNWPQPTYGANTFNVRATGGVIFATSVHKPSDAIPSGLVAGSPKAYCLLAASGTGWICASDRNVKERIVPITPLRVLAGVLAMPVSTWSIIGSKFRQMGPTAQDFYRAFGLGDSDKAINSNDSSGVAFAVIQGLNARLVAQIKLKDAENAKLKARLAAIEKKLGM